MYGLSGHILVATTAFGCAVSAANAGGIDYIDGNAFAEPALCEAMAAGPADQALAAQDGHVLAGPPQGSAFFPTGLRGICVIEGIVTSLPFGRGNGLNTVMVAVSCIDDVAVPEFELLALEFQGDEATGTGRVDVYPVGQPGAWGAALVGEYVSCAPEARAILTEMFAQ